MSDTKDNDLWAVVRARSGGQYLSKVTRVTTGKETGVATFAPEKQSILAAMATGQVVLTLNPAYEFVTPVGRSPDGGYVKNSITLPLGMTLEPVDLHVANPSDVYFLSDMKDNDREDHMKYIKEVQNSAANARAKSSPILTSPLLTIPR